jgi:hypothetical protein
VAILQIWFSSIFLFLLPQQIGFTLEGDKKKPLPIGQIDFTVDGTLIKKSNIHCGEWVFSVSIITVIVGNMRIKIKIRYQTKKHF